MAIVRLGPIRFGWCKDCNIPIVDMRYECGLCGAKPTPVSVTPPGDVRPAFEHDINLLRRIANEQFGKGCGTLLFPKDRSIILNKAPARDRMDEVILDGQVVCALMYELGLGYKLVLRMEGARRIADKISKGWIILDDDAVPYIIKGASVMVPGIFDADTEIKTGDEIVILNRNQQAIAVGSARMDGGDMLKLEKGAATKTRHSSEPKDPEILKGGKTWDDVVKGNSDAITSNVEESKKIILKMTKQHELPLAVSFSGGKDSLATLLLALEAGAKPKMLFVDTGLEFPETVEHVHQLSNQLELELLVEDAGRAFWDNIETFGPPSKDFRWCCKACKLGPTTRLINHHFPNGVLSLIGQRRYESQLRAQKGSIWRNPWVPGQLAVSPVQDWTALHIWLYIFMKKVDYNPWYERGLERIGCYLCPSSDMAELELVEEHYKDFKKWKNFLNTYSVKRGYPEEWTMLGLWRWKSLPKELRKFVKSEELNDKIDVLKLNFVEGYSPCVEGLSAEGMFDTKLDIKRVKNTANILGKVKFEDDIRALRVNNILIFEEGAVVVKGKDEKALLKKRKELEQVVRKSLLCVGCGTCLGLCKEGAIKIVDGKSRINKDLCIHCGKCLSPCPAAEFSGEFRF